MAVRLLVIAEEKLLPALAAGLREGGHFEVATAASPEAAQAALAEPHEAAVLFYGAPQWSLPAALQLLAPAREKGVHLIAVLQRQQAAQRDECFRNGASDAYFMPLPKDQFVGRLQDTLRLAYREDPGAKVAVQAASRTTAADLGQAMVTFGGVHAGEKLPFRPGNTVRLSWKAGADAVSAWGLVARGDEPGAQVRFAGLTAEEESRIRSWLKSAPTMELSAMGAERAAPRTPTPPAGNANPRAGMIPTMTPSGLKRVAPAPTAVASTPAQIATPPGSTPVAVAAPVASAASVTPATPAVATAPPVTDAPAAASPPAETSAADRAPQAQAGLEQAGAAAASPGPAAPPSTPADSPAVEAAATTPVANPTVTPTPSASSAVFVQLFEEGVAITPHEQTAVGDAAEAALGTPWPDPWSPDWCRAAAMALLRNQPVPPGPASGDKVAHRIVDRTASEQRTAADPPGAAEPTSAADALVARIALAGAAAAGEHLLSRRAPVLVDATAVTTLTTLADAAGARLQQEATAAIAKGDTEALRLLTSLRGSLSQELLAFKEMVDQLRGLASAALGAGGLDPELQVGKKPVARPKAQTAAAEPSRRSAAEFKDYNKKATPAQKKAWLAVAFVALVITAANGFYFSRPRSKEVGVTELERAGAGGGVVRVTLSAHQRALVTVTPTWLERAAQNGPKLSKALETLGVEMAILSLADGQVVGSINVKTGRIAGIPRPATKEDASPDSKESAAHKPHN